MRKLLVFVLLLTSNSVFADVHSLILAGGKGTRMKSEIPKVLHKLNGIALLDHVVNLAKDINSKSICIVTSEKLKDQISDRGTEIAVQYNPQGTGHAVMSAKSCFQGKEGDIYILFADTPYITKETLKKMAVIKSEKNAGIAILGMRPENTRRYGRIFADADGVVDRIVEFKDASEEERQNNLCNSGVFLVSIEHLDALLTDIKNNNASSEYYLTDIVSIGKDKGIKTVVIEASESELAGVNTQEELKILQGKD